jgi:hypothetical protein
MPRFPTAQRIYDEADSTLLNDASALSGILMTGSGVLTRVNNSLDSAMDPLVTLRDGLDASAPIIAVIDCTQEVDLPFGLRFDTGLFYEIEGADFDGACLVAYFQN